MLLRPPVLIFFALAITIRYWGAALAYLCLRSFVTAPSGVYVWIATVILAGLFISYFVIGFRNVNRNAKLFHAERQKIKNGASMDQRPLEEIRREHRRKGAPLLFCGLVAMQLLIPTVASLAEWNEMQSPEAERIDGKMRIRSPQEQLQGKLQRMQSRGVFMWLVREGESNAD